MRKKKYMEPSIYILKLINEECRLYSIGELPSIDCLDEMWSALMSAGSQMDNMAKALWELLQESSSIEEFMVKMQPLMT